MTSIQEFSKKLEVEVSDHERSILIVDIMNAMGFSKNQREIQRNSIHLLNVLMGIFINTDKLTITLTGSTSEGMCGGCYGNQSPHDVDNLLTCRHIKQYTPRTNIANNLSLLPLDGNEEYTESVFVEKMNTFQDMSNYRWRK